MATRTTGDRIAHAFTPWAWRSRGSVVALVVVCVALPVAFIGLEWAERDSMNKAVAVVWYGGFGGLLLIWPAVRSLRRWDKLHSNP